MRFRTLITAAAVPAALAAALVGTTGTAHAATGATGSVTCGSSDPAGGGQVLSGTISKNVDVPAGTYCSLQYAHVTGNVSAEGNLSVDASVLDRNVSVNGGSLWLFNYASHIKGNVSVTGSPGDPVVGKAFGDNTAYAGPDSATAHGSVIDGDFSFTGNTAPLYVGSPLTVRNFTYALNTSPTYDISGLTVSGNSSIS
jgi:hypothetical protein